MVVYSMLIEKAQYTVGVQLQLPKCLGFACCYGQGPFDYENMCKKYDCTYYP